MVDKAKKGIIFYLKENVLRGVSKEKTVYEMWVKFESFYMTKTLNYRLCMKQQIYLL